MYKIEEEIFTQPESLQTTYNYLKSNQEMLKSFVFGSEFKSIAFVGCGSSYSLCKSAAMSFKIRLAKEVYVFAAGDLMLNFEYYASMLKDALLIAPSRSGNTSEVINAVKQAKDFLGTKCISVCASQNSNLSKIADLNLKMPWVFDESVCQTRTVTNLYLANLMLAGIVSGDEILLDELASVVSAQGEYIEKYKYILQDVARNNSWNKVVVLADGELEGIGEEGALAFNEICQVPSNYYHVLDVRHGPIVLVNGNTLVIAVLSPADVRYQADLIGDLKKKGAFVVSVTENQDNIFGADVNIYTGSYLKPAVMGIPFIIVPQIISYYKALYSGINPDEPEGLDPWIELQ